MMEFLASQTKPHRLPPLLLIAFASLAILLLAGCSLSEDVTPPPGYQVPTAPPQSGPGAIAPASAPDLSTGAGIFAQKCAPCHGSDGTGNGPQAAQLPNPPAAIGSADLARTAKPADWYAVVTQGRLDQYMPGFAQSLSDAERWDAVWYAFSLSLPTTVQQQGAQVFQEQCASCHGEDGKGSGTQSTQGKLNDLTDPAWQSSHSESDIYQTISAGSSQGMPAFSGKLSADEIWAAAGYIRLLAGSGATLASSAATPQAAATAPGVTVTNPQGTPLANATAAGSFTSVTGQISNGSGGTVPTGLPVTLQGYDTSAQLVLTQKTTADASGKYAFPRVDAPAGRSFMVSVEYKSASFDSQILQAQTAGEPIDLPVKIYEPTTDPSTLQVDRMHVFFDFSSPGVVQVVQLYLISNSGDKAVVSAGAGQPVVKFELPEGASNLQFTQGQMGGRFVSLANGFGDTQSIPPGTDQGQVLFAYNLPYTNQLQLGIPITMAIKSAVVMVPNVGVQVKGQNLKDSGEQVVQGTPYHIYSTDNLTAGKAFSMTLSGVPGQAGSGSLLNTGDPLSLGIGLAVFVLVLGLMAFWFFKLQRSQRPVRQAGGGRSEWAAPGEKEDADSLIDAIIALDDQYQAGKIPERAYQERRKELKARLAELVG